MDKYYLTPERFEELKQELEDLKGVKRVEVAEALKRAKEYGDLSENSEYAEARDEQSRVETRISELDNMLKNAVMIEKTRDGHDMVEIGSKVTVERDRKSFQYMIVGSNESKPEEGKISNESPIGKALLNKKVGERVEIATPAGNFVYHITKVE